MMWTTFTSFYLLIVAHITIQKNGVAVSTETWHFDQVELSNIIQQVSFMFFNLGFELQDIQLYVKLYDLHSIFSGGFKLSCESVSSSVQKLKRPSWQLGSSLVESFQRFWLVLL